jgi:COMPASS component SWD3
MLASGGSNGSIQLWDSKTGAPVALMQEEYFITSVHFSPDNALLAAGGASECVTVWDLSTYQQVKVLEGHTCIVKSVCFSPNGKYIASCSSDRTIKLWDVATGQELMSLNAHSEDVNTICFNSTGTRLVSGSYDKLMKVWDTATLPSTSSNGDPIHCISAHDDAIMSAVYSPDDQHIASSSFDKSVRLWDASTLVLIRTIIFDCAAISLCYTVDCRRLYISLADCNIEVFNPVNGELLFVLAGTSKAHSDKVMSLTLNPDMTELASCAVDGSVKIWNEQDGNLLLSFTVPEGAKCIAFAEHLNVGVM